MSVFRDFKSISIVHGSQRVVGVEVTCRCGVTASHPRGSARVRNHGDSDVKRHVHYFERLGWRIGERPQDDRCPSCREAIRATKLKEVENGVGRPEPIPLWRDRKPLVKFDPYSVFKKVKEPNVSKVTQLPPPQPQTTQSTPVPREPSREDKRVILAKLEEVYDTPNARYMTPWTDTKVSTDLGTPRIWVEKLRNEFFGDAGSNGEINATVNEAGRILAEAKTLLSNTEKVCADTKATLGALMAAHQRIAGMVDRSERMLETIEKAVRP